MGRHAGQSRAGQVVSLPCPDLRDCQSVSGIGPWRRTIQTFSTAWLMQQQPACNRIGEPVYGEQFQQQPVNTGAQTAHRAKYHV